MLDGLKSFPPQIRGIISSDKNAVAVFFWGGGSSSGDGTTT